MKRITVGATFAIACATAITPLAMSAAHASDATAPLAGKVAQFQAPATMAQLKSAAQADAAELVKSVGLSADDTFKVTSVIKDADGSSHVRVDRFYKNIKVVGGDLVIHRDAAGKVTGHDGTFDKAITVDLTPKLSKADASTKGIAAAKIAAEEHTGNSLTSAAADSGSTLVIHTTTDGKQSLAYQVQTTGMREDNTPARVNAYIDADTGATLLAYDEIAHGTGQGIYVGTVTLKTSKSGSQFVLKNPDNGNYTTDSNNKKIDGTTFTDSDDKWGTGSNSNRQSAGVDAQYGADMTFDYYKNVLGRNGIWDDGRGARSRVHYDDNYTNAFWDGKQMTYGDGEGNNKPLTELDVSGHEMTHGVTQNSAGLIYKGDPGGLNESTSDIFGTMVEFYANNKTDVPDYLIGETIDLRGNGTPLRYMDKPSRDGVSPDCWSSKVSTLDPHQGSGPLNHWFYMASEGTGTKTINGVTYTSASCNRSTVKGDNRDNVAKVWYRTLATKLTSQSDYKAAREGAIASATELYGASSQTCWSVQTAFDAISVPAGTNKCSGTPTPSPTSTSSPTSTPTSTPSPTGTSTTPAPQPGGNVIVNGDFEQGATGWTGTEGPITDNSGQAAHSGSWKMWLGGNGKSSSEYEQQTVTVPADGKLSYWLHIDTKESTKYTQYDKATVSVGSKVVASYSNLDANSGFEQVTIDLSSYAGQSVTLKFAATEDAVNQTSFVFDDVALG